jgi:hypothetical protein
VGGERRVAERPDPATDGGSPARPASLDPVRVEL